MPKTNTHSDVSFSKKLSLSIHYTKFSIHAVICHTHSILLHFAKLWFFVSSLCVNLIRVFLHDERDIALVRRLPCELNISCTSTTAESRAKIRYQ